MRARVILSCSTALAVCHETSVFLVMYFPLVFEVINRTCFALTPATPFIVPSVWVIDQARGQNGWILAKFFFCSKKERGQYPAILTEQAWPIKNLLYGIGREFFLAGQSA